ncbi:MAG: DUF465 domain-containing protein [Rhodobacteraceae bacterium]|nr:DUF465 domain-containing protein [Paracoccaceae bacterium]
MKNSPKVRAFSLMANVARLRQSHRQVKVKIATELKRPVPCSLSLQKLKRKRLQIKDEITRTLAQVQALEPRAAASV